jgi:hypothetical protein
VSRLFRGDDTDDRDPERQELEKPDEETTNGNNEALMTVLESQLRFRRDSHAKSLARSKTVTEGL